MLSLQGDEIEKFTGWEIFNCFAQKLKKIINWVGNLEVFSALAQIMSLYLQICFPFNAKTKIPWGRRFEMGFYRQYYRATNLEIIPQL